jgi:hypothetical protein
LSAPKRTGDEINLLGRLVSQLLHDWFALHDFLIRLDRQVLLNATLTELISRPWIEI